MSQASEQIARQYANAALNNRTWGDREYNVKAYGAVGDYNGTTGTDNTASFRAAIAAAKASKGIVAIPPGNYLITGELAVDFNFRVVGSGKENTFISCNGTFTLINFTGEVLRGEDVTFRQVGGNVRFVNAVYSLTGSYRGVYLKFKSCNWDYFSNDGVYAEDVIDSQFIDCGGYGPYTDNTPGTTTTRTSSWVKLNYKEAFNTTIFVQNCYVALWRHAFHGINCSVVTFLGNIFEKNWISLYGTRVPTAPFGGTSMFWTIDGNWFELNLHTTTGGGLFDDLVTPANFVNAVVVRGNNMFSDLVRDSLSGQGIRRDVLTDLNGNMRLRQYTTANRPNPGSGIIVDTTLNKIIYWNEATFNWKDAMGTVV